MKKFVMQFIRRADFMRVKLYVLWLRLWTAMRYKNKIVRKTKFKQARYNIEKAYLKRYLSDVLKSDNMTAETANMPKIIWTCWWQGTQNMPPVVKRCIESMRRYCPDYEVRVITFDNMKDYVELPDYIIQKHKKGYISRTHLSDILRVSLLAEYGGFWMDATVFLTAPLPQIIAAAPFFAFHGCELYHGQNWFLKAAKNNVLIGMLQKTMLEYWKYENKVINYFVFYLVFDLVVEENQACAAMWQNAPLIYDDCYALENAFFDAYSPQKWADIKARTSIHKLSWKYKKEPTENSFLQYLLDGKLEN